MILGKKRAITGKKTMMEPLRAQSRIQERQNPIAVEISDDGEKVQRPRRRRRKQEGEQVEVGFNNQNRFTADEPQDHNSRSPEAGPENQNGDQYLDESTPSLESVYKNYRELKE